MSYTTTETQTLGTRGPSGVDAVTTQVERTVVRAPDGSTAAVTMTTHSRSGSADRPVVFAFNGGPGAASAFLDFGLLGPARLRFDDPLAPPLHPPFDLVTAEDSPLDVADVVMIDPVGTGLNRASDSAGASFLSVAGDARTMLAVIAAWCDRHDREDSPRYLLGESYGTIRIAAMLAHAVGGPTQGGELGGIGFNGIVLLGSGLDLGRQRFGDLRIVNALSSLAATALHHGAVAGLGSLHQHVAEASRFAQHELLSLLVRGHDVARGELASAAERMSELIGIDAPIISAHRLRIDPVLFSRTLLADRGLRVGLYDARYTAPSDPDPVDPVADDAAMGRYSPAFAWAARRALRSMGIPGTAEYRLVDFSAVNARWNWGSGPGVPSFGDAIPDLARAVVRDPSLRVFFGTGYFDLATPVGAADYAAAQLPMDRDRLVVRRYESGHMPYLGDVPRALLAADLRGFILDDRAHG